MSSPSPAGAWGASSTPRQETTARGALSGSRQGKQREASCLSLEPAGQGKAMFPSWLATLKINSLLWISLEDHWYLVKFNNLSFKRTRDRPAGPRDLRRVNCPQLSAAGGWSGRLCISHTDTSTALLSLSNLPAKSSANVIPAVITPPNLHQPGGITWTVITIYRDSSVYLSRYILNIVYHILFSKLPLCSYTSWEPVIRKVVISRGGISSNMP